MELLAPFGYTDPNGIEWLAPAGATIDGASIPPLLWSTVGSPFTGDYRLASVLHDYYCQARDRPHRLVHRMFYDAMRCADVNNERASMMYTAVRLFGPKWDAPDGPFGIRGVARDERPSIDIATLALALDAALGE